MQIGAGNPEAAAILAPLDRDADVLAGLLGEDGLAASICADFPALTAALAECGFAVVTEEALVGTDLSDIAAWIEAQPDWSDYPFVVLTRRDGGHERNPVAVRQMRALGNATFLERPFHPMTFVSVARSALSSRRRQYQARDRLAALEQSRTEIARSDDRLKFALEAGKLGAWELDFEGGRTLVASETCKRQFGLLPGADLTYDVFLTLIHPEDRDAVLAGAQTSLDTGVDFSIETRIVTDAAEERWIEVRGRAADRTGRAARMAGVSLDITARKQAEERQHLLIRELHHRVKNTLSTVQALVGSTARGATTIDGFYRDFTGRIQSLANTHTLLTEELWQRASLPELLAKELDLYDDDRKRITVSGPDIELPSDYAVPLGMAFHELTTNAVKYGALSNGEGRVDVSWSIESGHPAPRVNLAWVEEGGPPVRPPTRQGFGTRLLDRVLAAQLRADVRVAYEPSGIRISLSFTVPPPRISGPLQKLS